MSSIAFSAVASALPLAPPGSSSLDVVFGYGALLLIIGLVVWHAWQDSAGRS